MVVDIIFQIDLCLYQSNWSCDQNALGKINYINLRPFARYTITIHLNSVKQFFQTTRNIKFCWIIYCIVWIPDFSSNIFDTFVRNNWMKERWFKDIFDLNLNTILSIAGLKFSDLQNTRNCICTWDLRAWNENVISED